MDRLNNLQRREWYEEYFSAVDVPQIERDKRVQLAEDIDDTYDELFDLIMVIVAMNQTLDREYLTGYLQTRIADVGNGSDYLDEYAYITAQDVINTTLDHEGEEWYTSEDRKLLLAAGDAQTIGNYEQFEKALAQGKTHKTWKSELLRTTRKDHSEMHGKTIPIKEKFVFPDCEMLFPRDVVNGTAKQVVNCRCSLKYSDSENGFRDRKQSGAMSGALNDENDPDGEKRKEKAKEMYEQIRNRKREFEVKAVAKNTGYSEDEISRVYDHVFIREHLLDEGIMRFYPDYYMANSWFRLRNGKKIFPHDITMIKHELLEESILGESIEIPARKAHNIAEAQYNYQEELLEYLKTHNA